MKDWSKYRVGSTVVIRSDAIKTLINNGSKITAMENKNFICKKGIITKIYGSQNDGLKVADVKFGFDEKSWYLSCLDLEDQREEMLDIEECL